MFNADKDDATTQIDLQTLRERIRSMGPSATPPSRSPCGARMSRKSRANLVIEDMTPSANEDKMFAMMLGFVRRSTSNSMNGLRIAARYV